MGSVVPWRTLRGLHTDRLEVFSADLRLTFRGLPAEGLVVRTSEAASFPLLHRRTSTNEVLSGLPQEGLSWAGLGTSNPGNGLLGKTGAGSFPVSDLPNSMGATAGVGAALGIFGRAAGGQRVSVGFSRPTILAVGAATLHPASPAGGTRGHGVSQALRPHLGCLPGPRPSRLGCGILGVRTWMFQTTVFKN